MTTDASTECWYGSGLRFECAQCGACCGGAPGFVWVTDADVAAMARELDLTEHEFRAMYMRMTRGRQALRERSDGDCVLLDPETRTCRAYASRPVQCRTWPWWRQNVDTEDDWNLAAVVCPGIGRGPLHHADAIREAVERDEAAGG